MPTSSPKLFICSTVYDFRDLRSALREWLEEFGYEVLVSERTDFPQSPNSNSYKSCLNAIDKADYFLLLIGAEWAVGTTKASSSASRGQNTSTPTSDSAKES